MYYCVVTWVRDLYVLLRCNMGERSVCTIAFNMGERSVCTIAL